MRIKSFLTVLLTCLADAVTSCFLFLTLVCYSLSHVQLFEIPWMVACQVSLSIGFSRQEYWSGLPFALLRDLPNPGIKPKSLELQADPLPSKPPGKPHS